MDAEAIVVGAGPAGCAAALHLARAGVRVLLLEKGREQPARVCGEYLSPGTAPLLERLGVLERLLRDGARSLRGMLLRTPSGRTVEAFYPRPGPGRAAPTGLAVGRERLDPLLLEAALGSGARFEPGFQAGELIREHGAVRGLRGTRGGRRETLLARLVIGADGRASVVARRLGGVRRVRSLDRMALVGHFAGLEREEDRGEVFLGRDRYGILNPLRPGETNVGLVVERRLRPRTGPAGPLNREGFLAAAREIHPELGRRLERAVPLGPLRQLGPLAHRAARVAAPGVFLAGDAAGFVDPFTGEGIHAALRGAELASSFALELLDGADPARTARAYARAFRVEFGRKWRLVRLLQEALRRPFLAERLAAALAPRPALTGRLMAAFGDLLPAADLRLTRLLLGHREAPPRRRSLR